MHVATENCSENTSCHNELLAVFLKEELLCPLPFIMREEEEIVVCSLMQLLQVYAPHVYVLLMQFWMLVREVQQHLITLVKK